MPQSSISDAKRRGVIPGDWLIKLLYLRGVTPAWIKDGIGPKSLAPSGDAADINYPSSSRIDTMSRIRLHITTCSNNSFSFISYLKNILPSHGNTFVLTNNKNILPLTLPEYSEE